MLAATWDVAPDEEDARDHFSENNLTSNLRP